MLTKKPTYEELATLGTIIMRINGFDCRGIDAQLLGILCTNIQDIVDKVSMWLLAQGGLVEPTWKRKKCLPVKKISSGRSVVRTCMLVQSSGPSEFSSTLSFEILPSFLDVIALKSLERFGELIVWGIYLTEASGILMVDNVSPLLKDIPPLRCQDPFEIGVNVREIITEICLGSACVMIDLSATSPRGSNRVVLGYRPVQSRLI